MNTAPAHDTVSLLRPGEPFTDQELQVLSAEGVTQRIIGDLYAPVGVADSKYTRAHAAHSLLSTLLREQSVLAGETAAWVHGAWSHHTATAPNRVYIITDQLYRRPNLSEPTLWQIHQVPLADDQCCRIGSAPVTTIDRTIEDIYCGVGTAGPRHRLDRVPSTHARSASKFRRFLIGRLLQHTRTPVVELAEAMLRRLLLNVTPSTTECTDLQHRIQRALQDCLQEPGVRSYVSRRLPTVR